MDSRPMDSRPMDSRPNGNRLNGSRSNDMTPSYQLLFILVSIKTVAADESQTFVVENEG